MEFEWHNMMKSIMWLLQVLTELHRDICFYPRDAMLARSLQQRRFCLSLCPVRPSHAGIVPSRAKAGSWNVHHL